jgi:hypothetical protein
MLLSQAFVDLLPAGVQEVCRHIDNVAWLDWTTPATARGAGGAALPPTAAAAAAPAARRRAAPPTTRVSPPEALYTYDAWRWTADVTDTSHLMPFLQFLETHLEPDVFNKRAGGAPVARRLVSFLGADDILEHPVVRGRYVASIFMRDPQLRALRAPFEGGAFRAAFAEGLVAYVAGRWSDARDALTPLLQSEGVPVPGGDAPTRVLLRFMGSRDFVAPPGWAGFRVL